MNDEFEKRLQRRCLRPIPKDWREEILRSALRSASEPSKVPTRSSWLSTLARQLSALLWPSPKPWGVLVGAWLVVFAVQLSMRDGTLVARREMEPTSQATAAALAEQKRLMAELIGQMPVPDLVPDKRYLSPRSEIHEGKIMT